MSIEEIVWQVSIAGSTTVLRQAATLLRMKRPDRLGARRWLWGAIALGAFILLDLGLFGWLIFRSLSQREIDRVLLETRLEAETVADRLAGLAESQGQDLFSAVAMERETQTYIDSVLSQRDVVQDVEVFDAEGTLVFKGRAEGSFPLAPAAAPSPGATPGVRELPESVRQETTERQATFDVDVPIGEIGMLRIGISRGELQSRAQTLRRELVTQASTVAIVTILLLMAGTAFAWWLWRRGRRLEEQAAEAEGMAMVGTLASGLAHEIRNPLNALNLNMQLLDEELPEGSAQRRMLGITRDEIQRLERLVTDFLRYARPRRLETAEVDPRELFEACHELLAPELAKRGARLEWIDRSRGRRLVVDREQIQQLLINLIQNALAASRQDDESPVIEVASEAAGDGLALQVRDRGVGMERERVERIFEAFFSTRRGGTGLGLAVVQRIVREHGGEIEVESAPGVGTTVRVRLPSTRAAAVTARRASEPVGATGATQRPL